MNANDPTVTPAWLALREPADAAARSPELVEALRRVLAGPAQTVIHDLGSGTGSMGRWLAPRLPGTQHWVLHDRDPDLLVCAAAGMVTAAADGAAVTVETRCDDITRLTSADLAGDHLVTASALLDMLTADEIDRIVAACADADCPALLTISVTGRVSLTPHDPLDVEIADAFNAHQRRTAGDRVLLGPDAIDETAAVFARRGVPVVVRPSPWRLGRGQGGLITEWLHGWLDAAVAQRPELDAPVEAYARRRRADIACGRLSVVVHHSDLLAGPFPAGPGRQ